MKATGCEIKEVSLARLRERINVPCIDDDLLMFPDLKIFPRLQEPRRMNCLIIGICTRGHGSYTINEHAQTVHAGEALILAEGQVVDNVQMSDDCEGFACLISYQFLYVIIKDVQDLTTLFLLVRSHPVFELDKQDIDNTREYFALILKRVNTGDYRFRKDVVRLLLLTLIYDLGNTFYRVLGGNYDDCNSRSEQLFVNFLQLVERNFIQQRRVSWYAKELGITPKYLSETVSSVSEHTPNEWIERYVTNEIRNQLRKTTKKISEIAKELNFPNQSFLGKYFKESVGMSPLEYRKQGSILGEVDAQK